MTGHAYGPAYRVYQISFFVGYPTAVIVYIIINKIFPPEGLGIAEELEEEPEDTIKAADVEALSEKEAGVVEASLTKSIEETSA